MGLAALVPFFQAAPSFAGKFQQIKHIVIIYQENRSFDNLYGTFPGANGVDQASAVSKTQLDLNGNPYPSLANVPNGFASDSLFPATVPNGPWDIGLYAPPSMATRDISHNHYHMIKQANGGLTARLGEQTLHLDEELVSTRSALRSYVGKTEVGQ